MSMHRFKFLLQTIWVYDVNTRLNRKVLDRLSSLRNLFETFVKNFQNNYSIGEYLTLDEQPVGFHCQCSFLIYIRNKPAKYGLNIFSFIDHTFYTLQMEMYVLVQPDGPFSMSNSSVDVVR